MSEKASVTPLKKKVSLLEIESLLKPGAQIQYENVFSTRHLGRTLDFIVHKCGDFLRNSDDAAFNEYRLREILQLSFFNGWSNYRRGEQSKSIHVEFGWDETKFAFVVSHLVEDTVEELLAETLKEEDAKLVGRTDSAARIVQFLRQIQKLSDGVVLRYQAGVSKLQLACFIDCSSSKSVPVASVEYAILEPGLRKWSDEEKKNPSKDVPTPLYEGEAKPFFQSERKDEDAKEKAKSKEEKSEEPKEEKKSWLRHIFKKKKQDPQFLVGESKTEHIGGDTGIETVVEEGEGDSGEGSQQKSQEPKHIDPASKEEKESLLNAPAPEPASPLDKIVSNLKKVQQLARSVATAGDSIQPDSEPQVNLKKEREDILKENLDSTFQTVADEVGKIAPDLTEEQKLEISAQVRKSIFGNFRESLDHIMQMQNMQMLARERHFKKQLAQLNERIEKLKAERYGQSVPNMDKGTTNALPSGVAGSSLPVMPAPTPQSPILSPTALPKAPPEPQDDQELTQMEENRKEQDRQFSQSMENYSKALKEEKSETMPKQWAYGLLQDVIKGRSELNERTAQVESHLRRRELEFKTRQNVLEQQIAALNEQVWQQQQSFDRIREGLNQKIHSLSQAQGASVGRVEHDRRLEEMKQTLVSSQERAKKAEAKLEDVQKKYAEEMRNRGNLQQELAKAKQTVESTQRRATDEINKYKTALANAQAQAQAQVAGAASEAEGGAKETAKKHESGDAAQYKHKLDQSNKMVNSLKDELKKAKKRFDDLKLQEANLKVQLSKAQEQLKRR